MECWQTANNVSQQCAPEVKAASYILAYTGKTVASRGSAMIIPITLTLVKLHLEYSVQFCISQYEKDFNILE